MTFVEQPLARSRRRRGRKGKLRKSESQLPRALQPVVGAFRARASYFRNDRSSLILAASALLSMRSRVRSGGWRAGVDAMAVH